MSNTGKEAVFQVAAILAKKGLEVAILSPGSRNAPLIAAFHRQEGVRCLSIVDERSAAFFALGVAQQSRKPVAIVCTSGTAALNYAPAIAEAYYQQVPLVVITADRPPEWIDQGDGQSIRQAKIFEHFIIRSVHLPDDTMGEAAMKYSARLVHEAMDASVYPTAGPVHINVPIREPLYQGFPDTLPISSPMDLLPVEARPDLQRIKEMAGAWNEASSKLIVVGQLTPNPSLNEFLNRLAEDPSVAILTESTSNLSGIRFFPQIDRLIDGLSPHQAESFSPDILLSLGGNLISRKIKSWLQKYPPKTHWHVSQAGFHQDPFRSLGLSIPTSPGHFLEAFLPETMPKSSDYRARWEVHAADRETKHAAYLKSAAWSDLKAFDIILPHIKKNTVIQAGNSTPVRYLQLFDPASDTFCYGNRGTSGIDGCTSTAAGAAWVNPDLMLLITGDLAFLYDSNALWNNHLSPNLRIIVINNGGGNIFRIIEGPDTLPELEAFIETPYVPELKPFAGMFGLSFDSVADASTLEAALPAFLDPALARPAILEIRTPNKVSAAVLRDYFKYLSS